MNMGTEYAPLIEALAEREATVRGRLKPIVTPHETPAVAMAHGYFDVSGRPQVVFVHTIPGTLNAAGPLMNANSARVPVILVAGRSPIHEEGVFGGKNRMIHWNQELRDQGGLVRQFTKMDWEIRSNMQLPEAVSRLIEISMNEPKGPVYMMISRELMSEQVAVGTKRPKASNPAEFRPTDDEVRKAAKLLVDADHPLVTTALAGRDTRAFGALVDLAELLGTPVTQTPYYANFPNTHPLYAGERASSGALALLKSADVIFAIESDVPWIASEGKPNDDAKVIQLDVSPTMEHLPVWGFKVDQRIKGNTLPTLNALITEVRRLLRSDRGARIKIKERKTELSVMHDQMKRMLRKEAESVGAATPIDPRWLSHCINEIIDRKSVVFAETVTSPVFDYLDISEPGTYFSNPPLGFLGWAVGAALGGKAALPEAQVLALVGDGSYIYSAPTACHYISSRYNLPILTVIYNNRSWNASVNPVKVLYPDGWAVKTNNFPGCDIDPSPDFVQVAKSSGAHTERVDDPVELAGALHRALDAVKHGKQALVDVILRKP
jgi:acetolactate synthase-1/2/3 large subunit